MEERISARFEEQVRRLGEEYEIRGKLKVKELGQDGHENTSQITSLKMTMAEFRKKANQARGCIVMWVSLQTPTTYMSSTVCRTKTLPITGILHLRIDISHPGIAASAWADNVEAR